MLLDNKVAIITGAGSGFGKATSLLFSKEGAKIVAVDYNLDAVQSTVDEINESGKEAVAVKADVSDPDQVKNFVKVAVDTYGQINILFNNAGVYVPGNIEQTDISDWKKAIDVNFNSVFYGVKFAMPYLKKTKGSIISTASAGGIIGFPDAVSYGATKGGIISLTRAIAVDYAKEGVRANAICPGTGKTGMTEELLKNPKIKEGFLAPIPMKRLGEPSDVANAALFLASDLSSYITGHALPVDGGWTMS